MTERTKSLAIPIPVKQAVAQRDSFDGYPCCIYCGTPAPTANPLAFSNAHYIPRAQGGLGVEQNIVTLCPICHKKFDHSGERSAMGKFIRDYLRECYPDWKREDVVYGGKK